MNCGVIKDEPIDKYHACEAISSSKLKTYMQDPYLYFCKYIEKSIEHKSTAALEFGTNVHGHILEGHPIKIASDRRTKAGKETNERVKELYPNAIICTTAESTQIHQMSKSVERTLKNNKYFEDLIEMRKNCNIETTYRAKLKRGQYLQCRPDAINEDFILDLKTTQSLDTFERDIFKLSYHVQAGFYYGILTLLGLKERPFKFLAVEKSEPYRSAIFSFEIEDCKQFWESQCKINISNLVKSYEFQDWRSKFEYEKTIEIPTWLK